VAELTRLGVPPERCLTLRRLTAPGVGR
jgi:hypothetical protein